MVAGSVTCPFCQSSTTAPISAPISLTELDHTLTLMKCEHCSREWVNYRGQALDPKNPNEGVHSDRFADKRPVFPRRG